MGNVSETGHNEEAMSLSQPLENYLFGKNRRTSARVRAEMTPAAT
ncbi:MAG: hypothetical protein WDN66_04360 [Candidatus Saccharibacteria bacterium]